MKVSPILHTAGCRKPCQGQTWWPEAGEGSRELAAEAQERARSAAGRELQEEVGGAHGEPPSAKEIPSSEFTQRAAQVAAQW